MQSIVFADEKVTQPEGTTDNDIYGLDDSAQYKRDEIKTDKVSLSFDDIEDTELAIKAEFLVKMGFITVSDGKFRPDEAFTRYDMSLALQMITNMSGYIPNSTFNDIKADDERMSALGFAYENGYLTRFNDYTIRPDTPVGAKELLYGTLAVMGFKDSVDAVNQSGLDGMLKIAQNRKLLEGITYSDLSVSRAQAAEFLYNAVSRPINDSMAVTHYDETDTYEFQYERTDDKTLLSVYHDIYKGEGRVTATLTSGIGDYSAVEKDQLRIGSDIYNYTDVSVLDFFGYNTEFYYKYDDTVTNSGDIVYMLKDDSVKEIIVPSDEIISYEDNVLSYYKNKNTKKASVDRDFEFIKNGRSVKDCLPEDIIPENGTVTLVSNGGGSKYDTVIVWEYYNAVSDGISANDTTLRISLKYGVSTLEYDIEDVVVDMFDGSSRMSTSISTSYYYDGDGIKQVRVTLPSVPVNSVLSIFPETTENKNGKEVASDDALYVRVVVNSEFIDGVLTSLGAGGVQGNGDMYITTESEEKKRTTKYEIAEDNFLSESDRKIGVGTTGKFYLDYLGKVAACTVSAGEGDMRYGYLIDADVSNGLASVLTLKVLTEDNKIVNMDASEKLKINDASVKNTASALNMLSNSAKLLNSDYTISQLIKYSSNSSGIITEIETVTAPLGVESGYDEKHLRRETERKDMLYRTGWGNAFIEYEYTDYCEYNGQQSNMRLEMTHYIGKPRAIFCVPETETLNDDKLFSISDEWPSESEQMLTTELYDANEFTAPNIAVVYTEMQNSYISKPIMVVDRIYKGLDGDGNDKIYLAGYAGAGGYVEFPVDSDCNVDGIEEGDIILASGKNQVIYEIENLGNPVDIAKTDFANPPVMVKSKNKAPGTEYYLYTTLYETYDFDASTKTLILQRGNITDGTKREYQRASWWVDEWRQWGGAVTVDVDTKSGKLWIRNGTYGDLKCANDFSNDESSKILLIETYGYGMRFIVIVNKR